MTAVRIAQVVEATTGGVARQVLDLVNGLRHSEFEQILYLSLQRPESWKSSFTALRERGFTVRELDMTRTPNGSASRQLDAWAAQDGVDLLHLHSAKAGYLGRAIAMPCPVIYTPHAFPFQRIGDWRVPFYRMSEVWQAKRAEVIVCVSEGEREEANRVHIPWEKLKVINNGIDTEYWRPPDADELAQARRTAGLTADDVAIGFMGRLVPQKGVDLLLEAMEECTGDFPQARLCIWGDGPLRRPLLRMARRLGVKHALFYGEPEDVRMAYWSMDLCVLPSRWEAGPYTVLEAMATGLPLVVSDVPGNRDYMIHGTTGSVVETDMLGLFDTTLRRYLNDPELRHRQGTAARQHVQNHYTRSEMLLEYAGLYHRVAGR